MQDLLGPRIFMSNAAAFCLNAISAAAALPFINTPLTFSFALTESTEKHFSFFVGLIPII